MQNEYVLPHSNEVEYLSHTIRIVPDIIASLSHDHPMNRATPRFRWNSLGAEVFGVRAGKGEHGTCWMPTSQN
jgi:hypothetical protein